MFLLAVADCSKAEGRTWLNLIENEEIQVLKGNCEDE